VTPRHYEVLEQFLQTKWHVLHQGRRRDDGTPVLLKTPRDALPRGTARDLVVRQRGYFTAGKFDQIARIPYGGFVQAVRGLIQHLLTSFLTC
jgi:hypothetical protein